MIRDYLVYALESDPEIRVSATALSGEEALILVAENRPDVILMDVHLPGIDGIETTRRIMSSNPVPVVVCTASTTFDQVSTAMGALEAGALSLLKKPRGFADPDSGAEIAAIISTLKLMSEVRVVKRWNRPRWEGEPAASANGGPVWGEGNGFDASIIAMGASTGGPPVVAEILSGLPVGFSLPILVVQHIATGFTSGFAEWLGAKTPLPVHVARGGELPLPGHVYLAPDDRHMIVGPRGELVTAQGELHQGLRPSAGVLFRSLAQRFSRRIIAVLLTGMGRDGAEEMKVLADAGAITIAQDQESCVVFGMPGEAVKLGGARFVLPPRKISEFLVRAGGKQQKAGMS